jgi:site-specific DNA-adenine methylase
MLTPVTSYQGGKQRLASKILDIIKPAGSFYDLCCGSGAMSIELVNRGYNPRDILMVDQGPWGLFWEKVGMNEFDLDKFKSYCSAIPEKSQIQAHVKELSKLPADIDTIYIFLILQASSFGSKAIWIEDNKWKNCSFRNYWEPTATSNRRSPVNPMMPMPSTLYERVALVCDKMRDITGYHGDVWDISPSEGTIYIDPPYQNTTFYGHKLNLLKFANSLRVPCYVSEGKCLAGTECYELSAGRLKGGISGNRSKPNAEWLCYFKPRENDVSLSSNQSE